nr:NAD(P)-dependent oxidoreductase [Saprospiraceae bacterium]
GIVGFGNIGQKVATMASAFGMKVQYWSRSILSSSYPYLPLDQLQETSDILSIHVPLNPSTQCMIDHTFIAKCKKGVMFVNTARAQIFDRQALLDGLNAGYIGGYAADVPMSPYPTADDELNLHPKTLITAHVSSLTDHTFYQMCQMTVENVIAILKGSPVDPKYIKNYNELNFR